VKDQTAAGLRELRAEAKMTQQELAERSGLHHVHIAQLETGVREPAWQTVLMLAEGLGLEVGAFAKEAEEQEQKGRKRKRHRTGGSLFPGTELERKGSKTIQNHFFFVFPYRRDFT
jgi:transcriptional regulator with XRE-family HTH domain